MRERYPHYNLFLYEEGWPRDNATPFNQIKLSGIPILFIPGTAGKYRQARSLASVLLTKRHMKGWIFHFDVFTVDLNDELTALYGHAITKQTMFVYECIDVIKRLYM